MLYTRWRIMGTGPPAFTEVDNPASFEENVFFRVSETSKKLNTHTHTGAERLILVWFHEIAT